MYILGIESSCDETAAAVIERGEQNRVLDEQIKSQIPLHAKYGGVVPEIASRSHYETIDLLTAQALRNAGITPRDVGLIALTQGPGLIGSLLIGLSFAKGLSYAHHIPIVPVDHIAAHIEAAFIEHPHIEYPLAALVVSGGHTTLFHLPSKFEMEVLAKTRDDAIGEVMDKVAKYFGLGYPGGPILDKICPGGDPKRFQFSHPRMTDGSNDFSFSGYKTAVIRHPEARDISPEHPLFKDLIASFLHSAIGYLLKKTREAVLEKGVKSVIVSGGVSRNTLLRQMFTEEFSRPGSPARLYLPSMRYCTDNASMIAWLGYEKYRAFPHEDYMNAALNSYSRAFFKTPGRQHH